jgi:hypothetical protein
MELIVWVLVCCAVEKIGTVQVRVARVDEGVTVYSNNDYLWTYDPPAISALTPSNGPVMAGNTVIVDGNNFGVNTTAIYVGNTLVPASNIVSLAHTRVIFKMIAGVGARQIYVRCANRSSTASSLSLYTYDAPNVTSVTPTGLLTSGSQTVTVTGINFGGTDTSVYGTLTIIIGSLSCAVSTATRTDSAVQCRSHPMWLRRHQHLCFRMVHRSSRR